MNMNLGDTRLLIEAGRKHGLLRNEAIYVLATASLDTARTMKPVRVKRRRVIQIFQRFGRH